MFFRLLILFISVPIIELFLLIEVGKKISWELTVLIIFITAIIGARLTKTQGSQTIRNVQSALRLGKIPHREVLDGLMILVAGAILLTPGFLTDFVGFCLLIPKLRSYLQKFLKNFLKNKMIVRKNAVFNQNKTTSNWAKDESVIDAEIIEE
ncbi:MAG: FxsA family protein [Verrucomicrobiaceae bacterium]|nr:MAG: FxsA family protein [Verrucomicrobiaceae bacterium]